jgi:hypothetical protein
MARKMSQAEKQRNEFEKELKKVVILIAETVNNLPAQTLVQPFNEELAQKRILRAYDIAVMRTNLRAFESQQGV